MGLQYVLRNVNDTYVGASVTAERRLGDLYNETGRLAYPEVRGYRLEVRGGRLEVIQANLLALR